MESLKIRPHIGRLLVGFAFVGVLFGGLPAAVLISRLHPSRLIAILIVVGLVCVMWSISIVTLKPWKGFAGFDSEGVRTPGLRVVVPWSEVREVVVEPSPSGGGKRLIRVLVADPDAVIKRAKVAGRPMLRTRTEDFGTPIVWDQAFLVMDVDEVATMLTERIAEKAAAE